MLYAIYPQRDSRSPYAIKEESVTPNITLVVINVQDKTQIVAGLNYIFNKLLSHEMEPELETEVRHFKLRQIGYLMQRVKLSGKEGKDIWKNAVGALVKWGFPKNKVEDLIWV